MDQEGNGVKVTFSVKELLVEISRDIKDLRNDLNNKADRGTVDSLSVQVNDHSLRLNTLETERKQKSRWEDLWVPVLASSIVGLLVGAVSVWAIIRPH